MPMGLWTGSSVDVVIVGAGAAGVGAARHLQSLRRDLSLVLFEASDRIGGRARSVHPTGPNGFAVDLGCGWLHGARTNAWTSIAEEVGFTVDRTPAPWNEGGRQWQHDDADVAAAAAAADDFFKRVHAYDGPGDAALSTILAAGSPWNAYIDALGGFITGAELHHSSIVDLSRYDPGRGPDWRVREGYGTLVATYAKPLPVRTGTEVSRIDHSAADHIVVSTTKGDVRTRTVIVTVSTNVLAANKIAIWPPLPEKIDAASRLPLGLANKLFMRVRTPEAFPLDTHFLGSHRERRTASYQIRPLGAPVIEAYFAGDLAHDLERQGLEAAFDFALAELKHAFGADLLRELSPIMMSGWAAEPYIGGSYSYATLGASNLRTLLAAPHNDRLFFAGEACSQARYSTAHGAYESGVTAAERVASIEF